MVKRSAAMLPAPTDAELDILQILWARGPSTVRETHTEIQRSKDVSYTTTLKQMQVMQQKGLLSRSERFRSHVYEPVAPQEKVREQLAHTLLRQAFGGSALGLLQSALAGRRIDPAEIREIRDLLERFEKEKK